MNESAPRVISGLELMVYEKEFHRSQFNFEIAKILAHLFPKELFN
jgi:hypothetical protein